MLLSRPVRFLRRGLEFVDTPGIGSAIEANTETTLDFLPRSDAVIFVTSVDTPLTRAETDFLQTIREHVRKIFFVVNKIDLAADGERQEIMEFIAGTLKRLAQAGELRIFPVSSARFFANRQYELSARESARRAHAASLGFCSLHTWQLEATASPQGLSIGFSNLMERLSADLGRLAASEESNPGESVRALVQDPDHCSVCRLVRDVGKRYLDDLAGFVRTEEGRRAYAYSQGVCLRHLGMLIADMPSRETVRFLLDHAALRFAEIAEDMRNYALKRDALRADMQNQDEKDAYLRAVIRTAGAKRVCFPWDMDQGM